MDQLEDKYYYPNQKAALSALLHPLFASNADGMLAAWRLSARRKSFVNALLRRLEADGLATIKKDGRKKTYEVNLSRVRLERAGEYRMDVVDILPAAPVETIKRGFVVIEGGAR